MRYLYAPDAFPLTDWFNAIDDGYEPPPRDGIYGPRTTPTTGPASNYPPEWRLLSLQCRERAEWKCEECSIPLNLKPQRKFLHAHHIRGTQHNQPEDLRALCIGCHAEQPGHEKKVKSLPEYPEFMEQYGAFWKELKKQVKKSTTHLFLSSDWEAP